MRTLFFGRIVTRQTLAAGLLMLTCALPARAASVGEDLLARWIATIERSGDTVTIGSRSYDAVADRIDLADVAIKSSKTAGAVATLKSVHFEGLTDTGGSVYAVRRAWVEGLGFQEASGSFSVGRVEVRDLNAPVITADLEGLTPDLPSILKVFDIFRPFRLEVAEATDLRFTGIDSSGPASLLINRIAIEDLKGNRLGAIRVGPLQLEGKDDAGKEFFFKLDDFSIVGLDADALQHVIDPARYVAGKGDGVWRNVVETYAITGVSLNAGPVAAGLDRYGYDGFAVRQTDAPVVPDIVDGLTSGAFESDEGKADLVGKLLDIASGMRLGNYGIDGLWANVQPGATSDLPAGAEIKLGRIGLRDLSLSGLGEFLISGFSVTAAPVTVRLGEAKVADVELPGKDALVEAVMTAMRGDEPNPVTLLPKVGQILLADIDVAMPTGGKVALGKLELTQTDFLETVPGLVTLVLDGLHLPADLPDPKWRQVFAGLDLKALDLSGELQLRHDRSASELRLDTLWLDMPGGGKASVSAGLSGIDEAMVLDPRTVKDRVAEIGVIEATIELEDRTLGNRLFRLAARQQNTTPQALKSNVLAMIPRLLGQVPNAALRGEAVAAFTQFLSRQGTLTVRAAPQATVPLLQIVATAMANPWRLTEVLAVSVQASN